MHQCSKLATASNPSCNCMSATALCSYHSASSLLPLSAPSVSRFGSKCLSLGHEMFAPLSLCVCLAVCVCVCECTFSLQCVFLVLVADYATTCSALQQCCISACRLFEGIVTEKERTQGLQLYLHAYIYPINEASCQLLGKLQSSVLDCCICHLLFIHYMSLYIVCPSIFAGVRPLKFKFCITMTIIVHTKSLLQI